MRSVVAEDFSLRGDNFFHMKATKQTATVLIGVYLIQAILSFFVETSSLFVLSLPVGSNPWTLVTATYAHAGLGHLVGNLVALVIAGWLVERQTSVGRFHVFFVVVGGITGLAQVFSAGIIGPATGVIGASGAIFGLMGYALVGNTAVAGLLDRLDIGYRGVLIICSVLGIVLTLITASPRAALVAHFVGFLVGAVAGWLQLLNT